MNKTLPTKVVISLCLLFFFIYEKVNAQCSITSTTNTSTLTCGTSPLNGCGGVLYIGDGSTEISLKMDANLDLTCMGAIQFIMKNNATLDFSGGNFDLKLAAGSSIVIEPNSSIYSGGSCSSSDRIYINGSVVGNCNGSSTTPSFDDIVANGGINEAGLLSGNQYICTSGTTTTDFSSTMPGGTWSSNNNSIATVNSSTGIVTAVSAGTAIIKYSQSGVTATRLVYVASGPSPNAVLTGSNTQCQNSTANYTVSPVPGVLFYTWSYSGSGATISPTANGLSASITFSPTATSGNLKVTTLNGCGSAGGGNELWVTVNTAISTTKPTANNVSGSCGYAQLEWGTVSGAIGYYLDIATDSGFTSYVAGFNNYKGTYNGNYNFTNLPNGTLYYRVRAYDNCVISNSSEMKTITMVNSVPGTVSSSQTICSGTSPANLTLSGNSAPVLKWQKSSDAAFTSSQDISETSTTLLGSTIGNLNANTYFRAVTKMTSSPWCEGNSLPVLITVNSTTTIGGTVSSAQTICSGSQPADLTLNGNTGSVIKWQKSSDAAFTSPTDIVGTSATLTGTTIGNLTANTYFRAVVQNGTCPSVTSSSVLITVSPTTAGGSVAGGTVVCSGTNSTTLTLSGHTGTITNWESSLNNFATAGTVIANTTASLTVIDLTATNYYRAIVQNGSCTSANSAIATISVTPSVGTPVFATGATSSRCQGTGSVTYSASATNATGITYTLDDASLAGGNGIASTTGVVTYVAGWSGTSTITVSAAGCNGPATSTHIVTIIPTVGTPMFASGVISSRCQGAGSVTYAATSTNATGLTYALDSVSLAGGNSIVSTTGEVTYVAGWSGTSTITANAVGCNGPVTSTHTATIIPTVSTPVFALGLTSSRCQGAGSVAYSASATNTTGITYTLDSASLAGGNSIAAATGVVTFVVGWSGTSTITASAAGCNGPVTSTHTVIINPSPVSPTLNNITLACNQTSATEGWVAISGITNYRFDVSIDPSFGSYLSGYQNLSVPSNVTSLVVNGLSSGATYYVRARSESSCGTSANSSVVSITVNSSPSKPLASSTSQPTCGASTGVITVNPVVAGLGYSIDGSDYSNTTGVFNVGTGTYYVTAKNSSGCISSASDPVVINATNTTIWNGTSWDNGAPDSSKRVIFAGPFTITSLLNACSVEINSGVSVVVGVDGGANANAILKIQNGLDVLGTGKITFKNNASLVQVNDAAVNNGNIIYTRITDAMKNFDFTYWSSPVKNQLLKHLSPNTLWDKYYSYNNGGWKVEAYGNAPMDPPGKGYIIRVPKPNVTYSNGENWTGTTYKQKVEFVGVPNNGLLKIASQGNGKNNLIGNPYPSAIDAELFIIENSALINGALSFWTHNTAITQNGSFFVYSSNDYAFFNLSGGTKAVSGGSVPDGKIAAGQSFFVKTKGSGDFLFKNEMRTSTSGDNAQFFKMSNTKKTAAIEKNRVWLNLSNSNGSFKQLLVGYITGATNDMDNLYDGATVNGNSYVDFYSVNKNNKLTIQGRALPFDKGDKVPLGYKTTIQGTFQISIDKVDGVLSSQTIFLEDNVTNTVHDLTKGAYSFTTAKGTFNDRFTLVYVDKTAVVPPVVVPPPVVTEPPVVVNPPVVVQPPVVTEPPVVVGPPVVVQPPVVTEPPVVVNPPVVVQPPVVTEPPVLVDPPVVVQPPVVTEPPVEVDLPVIVVPPVVTEPSEEVDPPVSSLDPTIEKPVDSNKNKSLVVVIKNQLIKINSYDKTMASVMVYDLRGRQIFENTNVKSNEYVIQGLQSSDQFLIVMIQLTGGKWVTKEVIFTN